MGRDTDYLHGWPTICAGCDESCVGKAGVVKLGEIDDDDDRRQVMHGACYRQLVGTFEEFQRRQGILCSECREPCDGLEQVVELSLGRVMHEKCYENLLRRVESGSDELESDDRRVKPAARVAGEDNLSPSQIRVRRNQQFFGPKVGRHVLEGRPSPKRKRRPDA